MKLLMMSSTALKMIVGSDGSGRLFAATCGGDDDEDDGNWGLGDATVVVDEV